MNVAAECLRNGLLSALSDLELVRWAPHLEATTLAAGTVLYESGVAMTHVFFPTTCVVSLLHELENGASSEIAVVGREGIVGIALFMGGVSTPSRAVVQCAGSGLRLQAAIMLEEFNKGGTAMHRLLRYTQALLTQMAQTAVCNRHHSIDQQLCRWLLLTLDRIASNQLWVTQEIIARRLGVRREGVTEAAGRLQQAGLIQYHRGNVTVLNRAGLEQRSCECYAVLSAEYERLLPASPQCTDTDALHKAVS